MGGSSSKSKSAKVAADVPRGANDDTGPTNSRKRNLMSKGNGRLESNKDTSSRTDEAKGISGDSVPRDGLSSAPSTGSPTRQNAPVKRVHSAPRLEHVEDKLPAANKNAASAGKTGRNNKVAPAAAAAAAAAAAQAGLSEYILEGGNVSAEQVDE